MNHLFFSSLFLLLILCALAGCQPQGPETNGSGLPVNPEALLDRKPVAQLNLKAQELLQNGQAEAAIARLESALDLAPQEPGTLYNLAIAYEKAGHPLESVKAFEQLLTLNPNQGPQLNPSEIHKSLGVLYEAIAEAYLSGVPLEAVNLDDSASGDDEERVSESPEKSSKPDLPAAQKAYETAIEHYQQAIDANNPEAEALKQQIVDIQAQLAKGLKPPTE
jgi:tetratricopeptide (TPR) repeat protein